MYDSSCVIPVCAFLRVGSSFFVLYDPMNRMSDWPDQFFRAFTMVFYQAAWHIILFLRDFPFPSSTCVLFTSLITCRLRKIPWHAWVFCLFDCFATCSISFELELFLSDVVLLVLIMDFFFEPQVTLPNRRSYDATFVGRSSGVDVISFSLGTPGLSLGC
jgi:hypothetical protein